MSDEKLVAAMVADAPPEVVVAVDPGDPRGDRTAAVLVGTTWEQCVRTIAECLCQNHGPEPGCWCCKFGTKCQAEFSWGPEARLIARRLDRAGLLVKEGRDARAAETEAPRSGEPGGGGPVAVPDVLRSDG